MGIIEEIEAERKAHIPWRAVSETRCVRFVTMEVKDLVCNEIIEIKHVTETRSFSISGSSLLQRGKREETQNLRI